MKEILYNRKLVARICRQYMLIITVIVFCIAFAISFVGSNLLKDMVFQNHAQELELVSQRLDTLLSKAESESLLFLVSDSFQGAFGDDPLRSKYRSYLYAASINTALLQFIVVQPNIRSITFVDAGGAWFYRDSSGNTASQTPGWMVNQFQVFKQSSEQLQWYMPPLEEPQSTGQMVLFRKTYSLMGKPRGILIFQLSEHVLNDIVRESVAKQEDFLIYNQRMQPCMLISETCTLKEARSYASPDNIGKLIQVSPDLFLSQKLFRRAGLTLGILVSSSLVYQNSRILVLTTVAVGLICLIFSLFLVNAAAKHQFQPLNGIIATIKRMTHGNYEARLSVSTGDELQYLAEQINEMAGNTLRLMQEIRKNEEQKKQYELEYLQLQMQPHFLYNVLETLNGMIELGDKKNAIEMTVQVARFYRQVLTHNRGDAIIAIEQELDIAKSYLMIMQMRYHGLFLFSFDVSSEITGCKIPKLLLQPLLENSIIHGFGGGDIKNGVLRIIGCKTEDGAVCLTVEDNGCGIPPERLSALRQTLASGGKTSFGLKSIQERIKIYFGDTANLTIHSRSGEGTRVTLVLPSV